MSKDDAERIMRQHTPADMGGDVHPLRAMRMSSVAAVLAGHSVKVDYYTEDRAYLSSSVVEAGDVLLLASGGHGFTMLEQTEMIEVKQGPYAGDRDKVRLSPAE